MKQEHNTRIQKLLSFLYLIQGGHDNIKKFYAANPDLEILALTYDKPLAGTFYFPGSTWTDGRNVLYREAEKLEKKYDYYVFLDDDLKFEWGSLKQFEKDIAKYQPDIAKIPFFLGRLTPTRKHRVFLFLVKRLFFHKEVLVHNKGTIVEYPYFDACFNALKVDTIRKYYLLPYNDSLDSESWWMSQVFLVDLIYKLNLEVLSFIKTFASGTEHKPYPRKNDRATHLLLLEEIRKIYSSEDLRVNYIYSRTPVNSSRFTTFIRHSKVFILYELLTLFKNLFKKRNWIIQKPNRRNIADIASPYFFQKHQKLLKKEYTYRYIEEYTN